MEGNLEGLEPLVDVEFDELNPEVNWLNIDQSIGSQSSTTTT